MSIEEGIATSVAVLLLDGREKSADLSSAQSTELTALLQYGAWDPYAVRVRFGPAIGPTGATDATAQEPVVWVLERDMLARGLSHRVGDGDLRLSPTADGATMYIELDVSSGHAVFAFPADAVAGFLDRAFALVPAGAESDQLDLDGELQALIGGRLR
jgi:hypothetical protein